VAQDLSRRGVQDAEEVRQHGKHRLREALLRECQVFEPRQQEVSRQSAVRDCAVLKERQERNLAERIKLLACVRNAVKRALGSAT